MVIIDPQRLHGEELTPIKKTKSRESESIRQAYDSGNSLVDVRDAPRDTKGVNDYWCPVCIIEGVEAKVFPVRGEKRAHHFRHKTGRKHYPETVWHLEAKQIIADLLARSGAMVEQEKRLNHGKSRADVYAMKGGQKFAFEIQKSTQDVDTYALRNEKYAGESILCQWLYHPENPSIHLSASNPTSDLVISEDLERIGFIVVDYSWLTSRGGRLHRFLPGYGNLDPYPTKYVVFTDINDWELGGEGLVPMAGTDAESVLHALLAQAHHYAEERQKQAEAEMMALAETAKRQAEIEARQRASSAKVKAAAKTQSESKAKTVAETKTQKPRQVEQRSQERKYGQLTNTDAPRSTGLQWIGGIVSGGPDAWHNYYWYFSPEEVGMDGSSGPGLKDIPWGSDHPFRAYFKEHKIAGLMDTLSALDYVSEVDYQVSMYLGTQWRYLFGSSCVLESYVWELAGGKESLPGGIHGFVERSPIWAFQRSPIPALKMHRVGDVVLSLLPEMAGPITNPALAKWKKMHGLTGY